MSKTKEGIKRFAQAEAVYLQRAEKKTGVGGGGDLSGSIPPAGEAP